MKTKLRAGHHHPGQLGAKSDCHEEVSWIRRQESLPFVTFASEVASAKTKFGTFQISNIFCKCQVFVQINTSLTCVHPSRNALPLPLTILKSTTAANCSLTFVPKSTDSFETVIV